MLLLTKILSTLFTVNVHKSHNHMHCRWIPSFMQNGMIIISPISDRRPAAPQSGFESQKDVYLNRWAVNAHFARYKALIADSFTYPLHFGWKYSIYRSFALWIFVEWSLKSVWKTSPHWMRLKFLRMYGFFLLAHDIFLHIQSSQNKPSGSNSTWCINYSRKKQRLLFFKLSWYFHV